jgi:hypothetical protein
MRTVDGGVDKSRDLQARTELVFEAEGVVPWTLVRAFVTRA